MFGGVCDPKALSQASMSSFLKLTEPESSEVAVFILPPQEF